MAPATTRSLLARAMTISLAESMPLSRSAAAFLAAMSARCRARMASSRRRWLSTGDAASIQVAVSARRWARSAAERRSAAYASDDRILTESDRISSMPARRSAANRETNPAATSICPDSDAPPFRTPSSSVAWASAERPVHVGVRGRHVSTDDRIDSDSPPSCFAVCVRVSGFPGGQGSASCWVCMGETCSARSIATRGSIERGPS